MLVNEKFDLASLHSTRTALQEEVALAQARDRLIAVIQYCADNPADRLALEPLDPTY
jgi:hypothetical protein